MNWRKSISPEIWSVKQFHFLYCCQLLTSTIIEIRIKRVFTISVINNLIEQRDECSLVLTSSENWGILIVGLKMTCIFIVPTFAGRVMVDDGVTEMTSLSCVHTGENWTLNVMEAKLLLTMGMIRLVQLPILWAPNFTILCLLSATVTC